VGGIVDLLVIGQSDQPVHEVLVPEQGVHLLLPRPVREKLVECHVGEDQRGDQEHSMSAVTVDGLPQRYGRVPGFRDRRVLALPALLCVELPISTVNPAFAPLALESDPGGSFQPDGEVQLGRGA
jgi:hypothetical protein